MKVTVDTNVLVRASVQDDAEQALTAAGILRDADVLAVPSTCLCEFVWVLRSVYGFRQPDIYAALAALLAAANVSDGSTGGRCRIDGARCWRRLRRRRDRT